MGLIVIRVLLLLLLLLLVLLCRRLTCLVGNLRRDYC
jgi:hypothetical protein